MDRDTSGRRSRVIALVLACSAAAVAGMLAWGAIGSATPSVSPPPLSGPPSVLPEPGPATSAPEAGDASASDSTGNEVLSPALAADFAVFRRAAREGESAGSRKTDVGGIPVRLTQRGDQLCVSVGTPTACGPIALAATRPAILAVGATDGSDTVLYGSASDDIAKVTVRSSNGSSQTVSPTQNVYQAKLIGHISTIEFEARDGSRRKIVG